MDNPSSVPAHDAQRELERRALRNVRSLVDKLEGDDAHRGRRNLRLVALVLATLAAAVATTALALWLVRGPVHSHTVTIVPATSPSTAR